MRKALLDADVNYKVAKTFTDTVKEKALGQNVLTGEYIAFVDSDDFVSPFYISEMYTLAVKNNADIVQDVYKRQTFILPIATESDSPRFTFSTTSSNCFMVYVLPRVPTDFSIQSTIWRPDEKRFDIVRAKRAV